jgi:hypothetical protein
MPIKHPRDETEIRQLAGDLAARWRRGDGVEPWLRSLEAELSGKVRQQRWSWESIARALNVAGITYQTKRPWTGRSLLRKIATIRFEGRLAQRNSVSLPAAPLPQGAAGNSAQPGMASVPFPDLSPPPTAIQSATADTEPEFKPATLIRHSGSDPPETHPLPKKQPAPAASPAIDVDAVLARFTGQNNAH